MDTIVNSDEVNELLANYERAINKHNDGSHGRYRGPKEFNISGANTDREAISAFLSQYKKTPDTLRTYTKESERFHIWVILKLQKSIPDLAVTDYQTYAEFLMSPDDDWVSQTKALKSSSYWRPFTIIGKGDKGLSATAVKLAMASISSMLNWMVDAGYLRINPLKILRQKNKTENKNDFKDVGTKVSRFLDDDMWAAAKKSADLMPTTTSKEIINYERMRFMLTMLSMVGPRVSELSNAKMNDIRRNTGGWFWHVVGKGSVAAIVPVPQDMLDGFMRWRKCLGLTPIPTQSTDDDIPIIPSIDKTGKPIYIDYKKIEVKGVMETLPLARSGLSARRINELLKAVFLRAADDPELTVDRKYALRKASAHWMRHTSITQMVNSGMDRKLIQLSARHIDSKTTDRYVHIDERVQFEEAQKLKLMWEK